MLTEANTDTVYSRAILSYFDLGENRPSVDSIILNYTIRNERTFLIKILKNQESADENLLRI